ncbi:hypothetical protein SMF913_14936 [Streptomyces malaysiensis]|uniref:Uncharacterized protein n=1 Tax=Streptomyces malaysiensis TaxID=92644 RepID=A0A2J7ZF55_STRMQ|nr:hypothetical protein SMF913_14936 [Streptomyces malaysiensis]
MLYQLSHVRMPPTGFHRSARASLYLILFEKIPIGDESG